MQTIEYQRGSFSISTHKSKLNVDVIHEYLSQRSYWAQGRPRALVEKTIQNSLCFGVYRDDQQAGFARVVSDCATFAWLCDVFILEPFRGLGLGKWLIESVVAHPELQGLKIFLLVTQDAQELYSNYGGFIPLTEPEHWMARPRMDQRA